MGCGSSKDDQADLAGDFFGGGMDREASTSRLLVPHNNDNGDEQPPKEITPESQTTLKEAPFTPTATTSVTTTATTTHHNNTTTTSQKNSGNSSSNSNSNSKPRTSGAGASQKTSSEDAAAVVATAKKKKEKKAKKANTSAAASASGSGTHKNNGTGTATKKSRKNEYVAPPSSESFAISSSAPAPGEKQKKATAHINMEEQQTPPPPPPPPPPAPEKITNTNTAATPVSDNLHSPNEMNECDNDGPATENADFSRAPSLQVPMRSIVKTSFDQIYERSTKLGYGAFAEVFIGIHRPTKQKYAIKQVDRSKMFWGDRDALKDEILNLKAVREGPNIVQLYEVFEEKTYCFLVTELMLGGELFDRIIEKKTFSENEARNCCRCVLSALEYMHSKRVAHRDLKPENLLLADPKQTLPVKLADFGFAKSVEQKNGCRTLCGTPGYLAPEILERWPAYDVPCDVWSVGVILFLLLGGYLPFDDDDEERVFDRTRNGQYDFRPQYWRHISSGAKDLVSRCLTINPNKRISATQALNHEWMAEQEAELESHEVDVDKLKKSVEAKRKMKAAIKTLMAANRLQQLNDDFSTYMEKRRGDSIVSHFSHFSYMTGGTRSGHKRYVEDSPSGKPFHEFFDLKVLLGETESSSIYECVRKSTKDIFEVKHVQTDKLDKAGKRTLKDEIAALKLLRGGPHIVRLYDVFEEPRGSPTDIRLIVDCMKGGNLLDRIAAKDCYNEREARQYCRVAFTAIDYCHRKKVAHRDIKPDNFLLVEPGDDTSIKLADFGFAKKVTHENSLKTLCGTSHYVAPEVLSNKLQGYDQRCDIWSLGVFAFVILGGYYPFEGVLQDLADEIRRGHFDFKENQWKELTPSAKNMIESMLVVDPAQRISASQALACDWMGIEDENLILKDLSKTQDSIRTKMTEHEGDDAKSAVSATISKNKFTSIAGMVEDTNPDLYASMGIIADDEETFSDKYDMGEQIGLGTFSVVHEAQHKETKEVYAVKRITRKDLHPSDAVALHDEIAALQQVSECEHIVKLHDVYDEPDYTFLVLEIMKGGDLIDRIIEKRHYTEFDAKEVSRKLLLAVEYCHERKIANRNLKPENLLLKAGSDTDVKISDFGYAKVVTFPNSLRTQCGTEGYVAPEILEHRPAYDIPCDMWSLGVIIYIVLGGYRPFRGEGEEVMRQIRYGEYKFHKRYWSHVSSDARKLISRMLTVDPERRITAQEALKSPWVTAVQSDLDGNELSNNMQDLKNLKAAKAKMKNAVNTIIATNKLQSLGGLRAWQDF